MQVLCRPSATTPDAACPTCGQTFQLFWERSGLDEREVALRIVLQALRDQHAAAIDGVAHPDAPFNIPSWNGQPHFSGAALLGGLHKDLAA